MTDGRSDDDVISAVLQESAIYRELLNVALAKLHEADKRERYRRENHVNVDR